MNDIKTLYDAILKKCSSSTSFDIFGGQQPYVLDGELFIPLDVAEIPLMIKDQNLHTIYYREEPTTYCASSFHGAINMIDASEFYKDSEINFWHHPDEA